MEQLKIDLTDEALLEFGQEIDKIAIDVPFGWPETFVEAVHAHMTFRPWPSSSPERLDLRFRRTDLFVHEKTGKWPLSVSSDKIAIPAFRAAVLMPRLLGQSVAVDRTGAGKLVEVYPAAAMLRWGLAQLGRKRNSAEELTRLADCTTAWLRIEATHLTALAANEDALDALIASLVARAAMLGFCESPPEGLTAAALTEGWIALPSPDSLKQLAVE